MKKIIIAVLVMLGIATAAHAQWSDYRVSLQSGYSFGDEQHHYSTGTLISTNHPNIYVSAGYNGYSELVVIPHERVVYNRLDPRIYIYYIAPYAVGRIGYWYVMTDAGSYLVSQYGSWSRANVRYYGDDDLGYYYDIPVGRRLLLYYDWHLCSHSRREYYDNYYNRRYYDKYRYYHNSKISHHRPSYHNYRRPAPPNGHVGVNNSYRDYRDVRREGSRYQNDRQEDRGSSVRQSPSSSSRSSSSSSSRSSYGSSSNSSSRSSSSSSSRSSSSYSGSSSSSSRSSASSSRGGEINSSSRTGR